MYAGVDEAGKGPVLGSMFAAAVRADPAALPADVGDSKTISPARRESLDAEIHSAADAVAVAEIPVERIDDPATDMNSLTVAAHAAALADVLPKTDDASPLSCVLDAGDANADRFGRRVADGVSAPLDVDARHGADESDPVVGAASVVAKVARDAHVAGLAESYGDLGSGYPSDPTTRAFLESYVESHGDLPPCARASWQTCEDLLAAAEQSNFADF